VQRSSWVRLLPLAERAKQLFGEEGSAAVARRFETQRRPDPQAMFDFMAEARVATVPEVKGRGRKKAAGASAESICSEIKQALADLKLGHSVTINLSAQ